MQTSIIKHIVVTICTVYLAGMLSPAFSGECSDTIDSDGDSLVDWQYDQRCYGEDDLTEGGTGTGVL